MTADIYSSILGTLVMGTGNDNNAWGDNCNNSVFAILEAAIAKRKANAVTGGTLALDGTVPPAGASSAIEMIQHFSGTLGSNQIVQVPNISKLWLVNNACTLAGHTLTFTTSGGVASAAIPVGWCFVWCDGVSTGTCYAGLSTALRDTQFTAADGTVGAPGIAFTNALTTGLRHSGYASGTEANNPFTTTSSSAVVSVAHTAHGLAATTDYVFFSGATAVGGITLDGLYQVTAITSADIYTITHSANASSSTSGGGASVLYKYMRSTANTGTAQSAVANGADVAHLSPFGALIFGRLGIASDLIVAGATKLVGALTAVAATFTGTITGVAATLTDILTLSSTSHFIWPSGTTGQRPSSQVASRFRFNTTTALPEFDNGTAWTSIANTPPPPALFKNLSIKVASNTTVTVAADFVVTTNGSNYQTTAVSSTVNMATTGVDALIGGSGADGTITIDNWYHLYVIAKADGTTKVVATIQTTPNATFLTNLANIASGAYTYYARIGAVQTIHGSATLYGTWQLGRRAQYVVGLAQTSTAVVMVSGSSGSATVPTWVAIALARFVPTTASIIQVAAAATSGGPVIVAPNNSYGSNSSTTNPPPLSLSANGNGNAQMLIESTNIYWGSGSASNALMCQGWEDNI